MKKVTRRISGGLLAAILGVCLPLSVSWAQAWPAKPVRVIVPGAPGSPGDLIARALGERLGSVLGQSIVIDNRPGANFAIGTEAAARAAPDGYTLLLTASPHTINPSLYPNLTFDPIKDFAPITLVAVTPLVLVVHPSVPANSVSELLTWLRARPGKVNYGSAGSGSTLHLAGEMFKQVSGVDMVHVPYKGVTGAVTDLLGGHVSLMFPGGPIALPHVKTGKLRALATTGARRTVGAPDLPTVAESGLPGFEISAWYGMLAPAGTPPAIINRVHGEIVRALNSAEFKARWATIGADIVYQETPARFGTFLAEDVAKWSKLIKAGNIRPD